MAQEDHLTIEQLSAYIDRQLSQQEQVECEAHLQRCQQCRSMLADLRQTVGLLHALPQPELPRSFVLPARTLSFVEERGRTETSSRPYMSQQRHPAVHGTSTRGRGRSWQSSLRRSARIISTIAAVIGIIFIMSTLLLSLAHGGESTASSAAEPVMAPSFSSASNHPTTQRPQAIQPSSVAGSAHNPRGTATSDQSEALPSTGVMNVAPTQPSEPTTVPAPQTASSNGQQPSASPPSVPAILDVSMPEGRIGVGFILLILGVLGVIFSKRREARSGR